MRTLLSAALLLTIQFGADAQTVPAPVLNLNNSTVVSSGASAARTMALRFADTVNLADFSGADPTGATNSDAAFNAAVSAVLAKPTGASLILPAGNFRLSAAVAVSLGAAQSILIEGQGAGVTTITQTGQHDAIDVAIAHYTTQNGGFVVFRNLSIVYANAIPGSIGIRATSAGSAGQQGGGLYIENCVFQGAWNTAIDITAVPTQSYVSNTVFFLSSNTTAISFKGDAPSSTYAVALQLDNDVSWGGARFLYVGPFVQGVIARGLQIAAATQAILWDASAGIGEQFILADSYVMAGVYLTVSGSGSLTGVQISNNFFDGQIAGANELNMIGILQPLVTSNQFFAGGIAGGTGVSFGAGSIAGVFSGNTFSGFTGGVGDGKAISFDAAAGYNVVSGNSIINATNPPTDASGSNLWIGNSYNYAPWQPGLSCQSNGFIEAPGDAQYCTVMLRAATASVTPARLTSDAAAPSAVNCINIGAGRAYTIEATFTGAQSIGGVNVASVTGIRGLLSRGAGNAIWTSAAAGTAAGIGTAAATAPVITADTTHQCLAITITPPDASSWHWSARITVTAVR